MSKNFKGGLDSLMGKTEEPKKKKRGRPKVSNKVVTKSSEEGTKEGETRATFIVNKDQLQKIKAISKLEGLGIRDVVGESFDRFIKAYEKKKGDVDLTVLDKKKIL